MNTKYCTFCEIDHELTATFWYHPEKYPACIKRVTARSLNKSKEINNSKKLDRKENPEKFRLRDKMQYEKRRDRVIEVKLARHKVRYQEDILYRLKVALRSRLGTAVRRMKSGSKGGSAIKNLGCSLPELKQHLESQFTAEMNWGNHGSY